ncbi:DNA primase [Candidatus Curtissbacteria bacterium RIFCSPLOWO2_01_FULL_42_26]|uniref:DNA primase n=1 Tax=Candidatus Curtissbacteria bacterium RIFCSPLOWO2_01_FULL_42_26 TaxID=1797729 RepID=A0A1F5HZ29_9BACT|nr:MAG: DNA primase [Candidatus Curtissbacteria bacterium RIFCSPLOWO2_01_FULL_42_26]
MDQKDEVKSKVDIIEVISSYLPLKKAGRNFAGLCPFHNEKTPSFMVSGERQVFKCFGCGEAGDIFTFLEKIEGWDFRESLEELAKKAGVKLKKFEPTGQSMIRDKLIEINKLVAKFYAHLLVEHPIGEPARKYLLSRGIKAPLWEDFGLGFSPDSWDKTFEFLKNHGFDISDISQAGLIIAGRSGYFDRFRNRLMFPLKDSRGTILGFAGRVIEESKSKVKSGELRTEAKYMNGPETPVFNKGSILFGLDLARSAIREKNEALLVEGEFDVISARSVGVLNAVASKGTALTDKQVATLSHICETVTLCFDTDLAGDAAARRGIELLDIAGITVKVVDLGKYGSPRTTSSDGAYKSQAKYKDPDEFSQKDPAGFKKSIGAADNIYDYLIASAMRRNDATNASGKKAIGHEILPMLSKISDDLVRAHYIEKLARNLDLDVSLVADAVTKRSADVGSGDAVLATFQKSRASGFEHYFLALLLTGDKIPTKIADFLKVDDFSGRECAAFWAWLRDIIKPRARGVKEGKSNKSISVKGLESKWPKNLNKFVDDLYLANLSPVFADEEIWAGEIVKIAERIKRESLKRQMVKISGRIKEAERKADEAQLEALYKKFDALSRNIQEVILRW